MYKIVFIFMFNLSSETKITKIEPSPDIHNAYRIHFSSGQYRECDVLNKKIIKETIQSK